MASGTSGETDQDHTSYKFETAGFNASPKLLPVFMDYLLSPNLTIIYNNMERTNYCNQALPIYYN
uniref:Uncharacterized protein n=1 Tax=Meloidogyne incognita TaxID=6306 RepID=A0A914MF28_MELIC